VSDAFTTGARPLARATPPMISSGRLLSVELKRPPSVGPSRAASRSVASPIRPTSGTIDTKAAANTARGGASCQARAKATGTAAISQRLLIGDFPLTKGCRTGDG